MTETSPNHPAAGNARSALQFAIVSQWSGVPELTRWTRL